jgi:membrane-associated protease RseP (regulator of RpoE activity)
MLTGILLFVLGIFLMILAHEAGHFVTARAFGIKVEEFFIGFGPRLWSFRRGETEYGLKALPVGGYVKIAGMNPFQEPPPEDRARVFTAKPKWQRAVVLVAGSATHFVLAFLLLATFFWFVGVPQVGARPQVTGVVRTLDGEVSPASRAGLRANDVFVEVDGRRVDSYEAFLAYIDDHVGEEISLTVQRGDREVSVTATPVLDRVRVDGEVETIGRLGITVAPEYLGADRSGPLEGAVNALVGEPVGTARLPGIGGMVTESFATMGRVFGPEGLGQVGEALVGGRDRTVNDPVGVVGAARAAGQAFAAGQFGSYLYLFAFFNVFVGILNILPLPPLDGGHLAVLGFEGLTGRRVDQRKLIPITALVAGFLILFTFSLLYLDVVRPIPNPFQ